MTVLMRARNSGDTKWITWSANTADYEGIHAPEPILLNSAILEIIFGAAASKVDNDSDVTGTYVSDALEYLNTHAGGGETLEQTLVLGNTTGVNWISIADGYGINSSANRGVINILSGDSSEIALNAGNINITGGESSGDPEYLKTIQGGSINITGGESIGIPEEYSTTHGGWVNIAGGNSINNAGGGISIIGGTSANSSVRYFGPYSKPYLKQGGVINIQGGESNVDIGGSVYVTGGITNDTTKQSGSVIITGGSGAPIGGIAGNVSIAGGTGGWGAGGTISIAAGGGSISGGNVSISAGIASSSGSGIGGNVVVYGGASRGTNNGGSITIEAGRADELGTGGSVTIKSGRNNEASWNTGGDGGNILIESGTSGGDGNTSGEINITSGNGDYVGPITIKAGNSVDGDGGDINILGGISNNLTEEPSKIGGTITITGGSGNSAHGGNVVLNGGSDSSDYGGNVIINGGIGNVVGGGGDIILSTFNGGIIELNKIEFNDGYFSALNETEIRLYGSDNHFSGFKASTTGTNNIWTLPEDDGPDGYVLTTDGSGNLSWSEGGGNLTDAVNTGMVMLAGIATNATESWETIGTVHYIPEEHSDTTTARLRALINTNNTDGYTKLRVRNLTHNETCGAEMTSNSTSFDAVSAVIPLNTEEAVYALQICTDNDGYVATASNAWVQLGTTSVTTELTTVPTSVYAGVESVFTVNISSEPWVLIIEGEVYATGTGTGSGQNVPITIPTGNGKRDNVPVRLSVGVTEDTSTVNVQEILELGSLCVSMTPGHTATQAYTGHGGDLFIWVGTYFSTAPGELVTGITYGGKALTKVSAEGAAEDSLRTWIHCYRLAAADMPAVGEQDIVVSFVNSMTTAISLAVVETNGTMSVPDDVQHGSSACPNNTNVSVTTAVDNSVVIGAIICSDNATYTPLSGQTIIGEVDPGMYAGMAIGWYQAGTAGSVAANWTPIGYGGSAVITTAISIRPS